MHRSTILASVPGRQRILVLSTTADEAELVRMRRGLGRNPLVLTAPTAEAKRVVSALRVEPQVEVLLAPVSYPQSSRGHDLDALVRRHALPDRFRDVVVVTDPASATLLLRALAPDQLPMSGPATEVGLPRGDRQVVVRRAVVSGLVLGVVSGAAESLGPILTLPGIVALAGLVLLVVPSLRHFGREMLIAAAIAVVVLFAAVAGSARFPGGW